MRLLISAAVVAALLLTGCSTEPAHPALGKADHVRAKYRVVDHPAASLPDDQIARVANAACDLVESHGGNIAILDTLAVNTPVAGWSSSQVLQLNIFAAQVYCPEIVGEGYMP